MTAQELTTAFGKNIKNFRVSYNMSQEELADKMDLSVNTICQIEKGRKFARAETLVGFAALFHTEVYELFKPETVLPDDAAGILVRYIEDVKEATEKIKYDYLGKMKQ